MTPRQQLDVFFKKYEPAVAKLAKAAVLQLQKRLPSTTALVYDNYNALVIGFTPGRPSDAFVSIALYPKWVRLFFLHGVLLPDPAQRLEGSGKLVRSIRLESLATLSGPGVDALISAAAQLAGCDTRESASNSTIVIQSISAKQRPRRSPAN